MQGREAQLFLRCRVKASLSVADLAVRYLLEISQSEMTNARARDARCYADRTSVITT